MTEGNAEQYGEIEKYLSSSMKIYDLPVDKLVPYENNPRLNDEAVPALMESIKRFGFKVPMVISKDFIVITGHTRLKAVKRLGWKTVPCIFASDLTDQEVEAFRLADNKVGEIADWDERALLQELQRIATKDNPFDMGLFGFDDVETMLSKLADEGETAKLEDLAEDDSCKLEDLLEKPPRIKRGEVWKVGRHRLMCGDSTKEEDVAKLLGGEKADLLITDPPYGVSYEGGTEEKMTIENDSLEGDEFVEFLSNAFAAADKHMKPGAVFYIWHADSKGYEFRKAVNSTKWTVRECLIWVKNTLVLGRQDYQWKHEPCLYGWKDGAPHVWNSDRSQTTVLEYDKPQRNGIHPTMKPVALFEYQIRNSSKPKSIVLDLFGGSGTTGVACERSDRTAYMMEYAPNYAEAALARLEELTGEKAERIAE